MKGAIQSCFGCSVGSSSCCVTIPGYSDGSTFTSALTDTTSGGECLQNLKLMVQISSKFGMEILYSVLRDTSVLL